MRIVLLFALVVFSHGVLKAQAIRVELNKIALDEKSKKMQAVVAVYQYKGQPFEDPVLNGIESKEKPHTFVAKLPNLTGVRDTNYAFIYFGGIAKNPDLSGYVFTIIANNTRNAKPCLLWIDRNFNLDLSDDGAPDTFYFNTKYKDITFINPGFSDAKYTTRISRFPFNYNPKYLSMLDDYYKNNSGSKTYSGSFFSFREERLNIKAGDYLSGNDSFRIALKDVNCNGIFNEPGVDALLLGDYKNDVLSDLKIPIQEKKGKTFFERNGKHYDILDLDSRGGFISLSLNTNAKIKNSLSAGGKIRKFKFSTTDNESKKLSIRKFRKKPLYIYVWRFGDDNFDKDTAALREISKSYSDKFNVVTLNYGETPKELKLFKNRNRINWLVGYSTLNINAKLFIEKYPTGILTKKRLRISHVGISPSELLDLLKNNSL